MIGGGPHGAAAVRAVLPASGPVWLELSGPEGTRDFLRTVLNLP